MKNAIFADQSVTASQEDALVVATCIPYSYFLTGLLEAKLIYTSLGPFILEKIRRS